MKPSLRKLLLTIHVAVSLGWFGAAASVLALAITGLASTAGATAIYAATAVVWRAVIIPFSLAALLTGIAQALGTHWGLLRHYWVIAKLVIAVGAVLLLLAHTGSLLPALANAAADGSAIVVEGHSCCSSRRRFRCGSHGGRRSSVAAMRRADERRSRGRVAAADARARD
jgi:hypothetical protein